MSNMNQGPQPFWVICQTCFTKYEFPVCPEGFYNWRNRGHYIQDALPGNTPEERELILNQICGPCFDKLCPPDDDE
jgi:hypothetical protein